MDECIGGYWQIGFVVAIALGAGLLAFGGYLEPSQDVMSPGEMMRVVQQQVRSEEHYIASGARGVGIGLMTLGGLGLLVPWINVLLSRAVGRHAGMPENHVQDGPGR